tara:strand:+ start:632 stop:1276 length:645 start_codon:yes stop_codon:yes gene_type:complete
MPLPVLAAVGISAGVSALGNVISGLGARKKKRRAARRERKRRKEMNRLKEAYSQIETSNPFLNQENVYEDLTIDQRGAQFEAQQFQQSQANILNNLRQSAGGSGIAALAQQMAQSGQLAAQSSAARIGQQERANERLAAGEAGRLQGMERQGELISRQQQRDQTGTLLGMSQQEVAAARDERQMYANQQAEAFSSAISGVGDAFNTGIEFGAFD